MHEALLLLDWQQTDPIEGCTTYECCGELLSFAAPPDSTLVTLTYRQALGSRAISEQLMVPDSRKASAVAVSIDEFVLRSRT